MLSIIRRIIPQFLFTFFQPPYHRFLSWLAAVLYRYPSHHLTVIGVTGTNGKSTTVELLAEIIDEAGYQVASISSIRFRVGDREKWNDKKMTMPGRFFIQKFLRRAVRAGVTHAVLEVTSEGIKQFRHRHIAFDMAVITNVTPEHIESHGSFEAYRAAKAELFKAAPLHVLNEDDTETYTYLSRLPAKKRFTYSLADFPEDLTIRLPGDFNRENALAALTAALALGIGHEAVKRALERIDYIPGRLEVVQAHPFGVIVDYAHTPDALEKVYKTLSAPRLICVLGSAGGGRDKWKRKELGRIAAKYCDNIILTNEDPYDEPPADIIRDVEQGVLSATSGVSAKNRVAFQKVLDRREAIRTALMRAKRNDVVVITGKGCESWIMGPAGTKIPWDDREVAREELQHVRRSA